ncbi:hypothetical protein SS50377_23430 [Spironucleus salmonicida]|uniref:Uncharacterized protein n=1 Tax=Spironucleus salmonicida TaxID=348837 RepID=V6LND1_9EUKA|nr:hypothetical protein SS50377_23430 [Spironucleus salmonicida]|eukprot:EST46167.1 Hypothetical protein SS50377_13759 [Spironucleus salmonicida]
MPIQYPTYNVQQSPKSHKIVDISIFELKQQLDLLKHQVQQYELKDQLQEKQIVYLQSEIDDKNTYINLLIAKYDKIIEDKDKLIYQLTNNIIDNKPEIKETIQSPPRLNFQIQKQYTKQKQIPQLQISNSYYSKQTPDSAQSVRSKQNSSRETYVSPYSQKATKQKTPELEKMLSCQNLQPFMQTLHETIKAQNVTLKHSLEDTVFADTIFKGQGSVQNPTATDLRVKTLRPLKIQITPLPQSQILDLSQINNEVEVKYKECFSVTIVDKDDEFIQALENKLCKKFGLSYSLLFAQKKALNTLFISSSELRKRVCEFFQNSDIQFTGIQTVSAVIYGNIIINKIKVIAQKYNFYDIVEIENGLEILFEDEKDCQDFINYGTIDAQKLGLENVSIGLKI